MNPEILQPKEIQPDRPELVEAAAPVLEQQAQTILQERRQSLESLRSLIARKLYYRLEEKIKAEDESFRQLMDIQTGRKKILDQYTFILDTEYFEQKLLPL